MSWFNRPCPHRRLITACITCRGRPGRDLFGRRRHGFCLCQDFRDNVCARCFTLVRR